MRTIFLITAAVAAFGLYADTPYDRYAKYTKARRYCVSRTVTPDGKNIVTVWHRDGKPDWILPSVETNAVKTITGKEQNNPLQDTIVKIDAEIKRQLEMLLVASNRYVLAESKIANAKSGLSDKRAEYVEKRDKASLPTTKAIYQAFIDIIDDIMAKLDAIMNKED